MKFDYRVQKILDSAWRKAKRDEPEITNEYTDMQALIDEVIEETFFMTQEGDNGEWWSDSHVGGKRFTNEEKIAQVKAKVREYLDIEIDD